jgi:hypothetical protein
MCRRYVRGSTDVTAGGPDGAPTGLAARYLRKARAENTVRARSSLGVP